MVENGKLDEKWEGKVSAKVKGAAAEQVWPLLEDFFGIARWHPSVDTCRRVDGPETIRYCETTITREETGESHVKWANERLIESDTIGRQLRYEVQENNVGFGHWIAAMKVVSFEESGDSSGCKIEWSFVGEPVKNWAYQDLLSFYEFSIRTIAQKMEHALLSPA